jgi:hypothetical protein
MNTDDAIVALSESKGLLSEPQMTQIGPARPQNPWILEPRF